MAWTGDRESLPAIFIFSLLFYMHTKCKKIYTRLSTINSAHLIFFSDFTKTKMMYTVWDFPGCQMLKKSLCGVEVNSWIKSQ